MADVAAAAAAMGLPEALVERSAEARAAETGQSADEILAAWAGGEGTPTAGAEDVAPAAEPPDVVEAEEPSEEETGPEPAAPEIVVEVPATPVTPSPTAAPSGPYKPPVLIGTKDNPMAVLAGAIGLFVIVVMVGLVGPSIPIDAPGARSSSVAFSDAAIEGQHIYETTGCASCHTQMVRPVVADVGLGPVTLDDTDQVLGTRRFGPDLSDVGSRLTSSQIEATIGGLGEHPAQTLSSGDLNSLVAYLVESSTSPGGGS